ncbi:MAG TPA: 30S ribosomal protein S17 [Candidatus Eremiobacteraceae bacterium]|nr:30S ribosomal protein S17 [Candidatus Eremiobacteraceae bacterium]
MEQTQAQARLTRRSKTGRVVSNTMKKTIIVVTELRTAHPTYGKTVRRTHRFAAHDEKNEAGIGDLVRIAETRPLSATKRWRLVEILEKAK